MPPYWRAALGRRDRDRTCCLGAVSQSGPQKAWRNQPLFAHSPPCLVCVGMYNTALQKVFPPRKHVVRNFGWPCSGCVCIFLFRLWNKVTGRVYYLRARDGVVFAARWSSMMLPYVGPEIIAVMQTVCSFAPNDSSSATRLTFRKRDDRLIPSMALSSNLSYSNSSTAGVLDVLVHSRP